MDRKTARARAMKLIYEWEMGGDGGEDTRLELLEVQPGESEIDFMNRLVEEHHQVVTYARIHQLLGDFGVQIDEQRILTEVAIFADRAAIDEELVRLGSHFTALEDILSSPEPAGRRLDFLMQEMNRETNTIGSKANNSAIAHLVVEMKNELEKIREQIQNIE